MDYELDILLNGVRHVVIGDHFTYSQEGRWSNVQMMRGSDLVLAASGTDMEWTARPYDETRRKIEAMARGRAPLIGGDIAIPRPEPDFAEVFGVGDAIRVKAENLDCHGMTGVVTAAASGIYENLVVTLVEDPSGMTRTVRASHLEHDPDDYEPATPPRIGSPEHEKAQADKNAIFKAALERTAHIPAPTTIHAGDLVRKRSGGIVLCVIGVGGGDILVRNTEDALAEPFKVTLKQILPAGAIDQAGNPITPPPAMNTREGDDG